MKILKTEILNTIFNNLKSLSKKEIANLQELVCTTEFNAKIKSKKQALNTKQGYSLRISNSTDDYKFNLYGYNEKSDSEVLIFEFLNLGLKINIASSVLYSWDFAENQKKLRDLVAKLKMASDIEILEIFLDFLKDCDHFDEILFVNDFEAFKKAYTDMSNDELRFKALLHKAGIKT